MLPTVCFQILLSHRNLLQPGWKVSDACGSKIKDLKRVSKLFATASAIHVVNRCLAAQMDISPLHFPLDLWFPAMLLLWLRHLSKTELRIFPTSKRRGQSNRTTDDNAHQRKQPQAEKLNTSNISIWILDWLSTILWRFLPFCYLVFGTRAPQPFRCVSAGHRPPRVCRIPKNKADCAKLCCRKQYKACITIALWKVFKTRK